MLWTVLLFVAGSLAIPAPVIQLLPPHPSSQDDPIYIECKAPGDFPGANFTLYSGRHVVQLLQAPAGQFGVTFNLSGGSSETPGGIFQCQYGVMGEHSQTQLSDLSGPVQVSFPVPTWILALSLSLAGAVLFLAVLVTVVIVIRKVKATDSQKKRERESCWAQVNFATSDMSFDNTLFAISMKMDSEDAANLDVHSSTTVASSVSGTPKRPTSTSSSPEPSDFSTFRAPL